jgi:hypothetical protein
LENPLLKWDLIDDNNLHNVEVTIYEDYELGGEHDWFIFHKGELTELPEVIIDELVENDDIRTL